MRTSKLFRAFTLINLVMIPLGISALDDYYMWVDKDGITNFAEQAPNNSVFVHITERKRFGYAHQSRSKPIKANQPESNSGLKDQLVNPIDPNSAITEEKAKYEAELASARQRNCTLAKQNLARLETFARIRVKGDNGEYRYLGPKEMETKKIESREAIKSHCQ